MPNGVCAAPWRVSEVDWLRLNFIDLPLRPGLQRAFLIHKLMADLPSAQAPFDWWLTFGLIDLPSTCKFVLRAMCIYRVFPFLALGSDFRLLLFCKSVWSVPALFASVMKIDIYTNTSTHTHSHTLIWFVLWGRELIAQVERWRRREEGEGEGAFDMLMRLKIIQIVYIYIYTHTHIAYISFHLFNCQKEAENSPKMLYV